MIIDGLPVLPSAPTSGDEIPIERGTNSYKIDYNALAVAIISQLGGNPVTIAHGGTGLTVSPSLLVNLASTSAANILQQSPRPGVDGVLPVANGGTGANTASGALTNLGAFASANVYNGLDKNSSGFALDARVGSLIRLLSDEIANTTQNYTFDSSGVITQVTHVSGSTTIRTDAFVFSDTTVTETRTLNNGAKLIIATNLNTLQTVVTYTAA